jgi:hypothetical protein
VRHVMMMDDREIELREWGEVFFVELFGEHLGAVVENTEERTTVWFAFIVTPRSVLADRHEYLAVGEAASKMRATALIVDLFEKVQEAQSP